MGILVFLFCDAICFISVSARIDSRQMSLNATASNADFDQLLPLLFAEEK